MSTKDELPLRSAYESLSIEELARHKGVEPVTSHRRRRAAPWARASRERFVDRRQLSAHGLPLATLNTKDFHDLADHEGLTLLTS